MQRLRMTSGRLPVKVCGPAGSIYLEFSWKLVHELFGLIDFKHLLIKFLRASPGQLNRRVNPSGLQEFCIFLANSFDPKQVDMIHPAQKLRLIDA